MGTTEATKAPSYFSQFFANQHVNDCNALRTLYIDRDPITFGDIARHLQGSIYFSRLSNIPLTEG